MLKDYSEWHQVKQTLEEKCNLATFKERQVLWCSLGSNIGHEMDGKNKLFNRPVLVLKKFNKQLFWGIPLTTKIKDNPYYFKIHFQEKEQCAMLTQLRLWDAHRFGNPMGYLSKDQFNRLREAIKGMV